MLKYAETRVVFREVPDEVTLAVNITGCPVRCTGCHSPHLAEDEGEPLDAAALTALADKAEGVTCVALMGGDAEPESVLALAKELKRSRPWLRTCWYSGREINGDIQRLAPFDYIKTGPYVESLGPLDSPATNQRFFKIVKESEGKVTLKDITYRFRTGE